MIQSRQRISFPVRLLVGAIFLCFLPGTFSSKIVTLESIMLFNTHEWLVSEPTVYFHCKGENKTVLPDVKKTQFLYTFKGAESWQPLTELPNDKCKRCGLYEKDSIKSDDVFDEWELCPDDFVAPDGIYLRSKEKEFNATLSCPQCVSGLAKASRSNDKGGDDKGMHVVLVILISAFVSTVSIIGVVAAYRYWLRKKREQEQARFLKLFEEGDDIEDELGLGHVI
ncbi:uncharacterized protein LOC131243548 [Magnolia sinica]|uniref:uncharacterized protein LOC131243548 n=1 Tax=Magnolia sinica TaxID=86752 RepID=UPI00265A4A79|nr:uncharacterized protein LOC131243548 [Magnolia sinica]